MKILIFLLIFIFFNANTHKYKIILKDTYTRFSYSIYGKEKRCLGRIVYLLEDEIKRGLYHYYLIYILDDGKKFIQISEHTSREYRDKVYKIKKANRYRSIKNKRDTGMELPYRFKIFLEDKYYEFDIFGDVTYFYLYDENRIKMQNKEAISYLISKDERIKEFIVLMANDNKKLFSPFKYVLQYAEKDYIKSLGMKEKKYKIKKEYFPCTEAEKFLNHVGKT